MNPELPGWRNLPPVDWSPPGGGRRERERLIPRNGRSDIGTEIAVLVLAACVLLLVA
jgi:hypothetical protein